MVEAVKEVVERANKDDLILLRIKDLDILLEIASDEGEKVLVKIGEGGVRLVEPDVKVYGKKETLLKILRGEADIMRLFLFGKIRFKGDPNAAFTIYERLKELIESMKRR